MVPFGVLVSIRDLYAPSSTPTMLWASESCGSTVPVESWTLLYANAAAERALGVEQDSVGMTMREAAESLTRQTELMNLVSDASSDGGSSKRQIRVFGRWSIASAYRIDDIGGPVLLRIEDVNDLVTQLQLSELHVAELSRVNAEIRDLAHSLSHDLQEPIRTLYRLIEQATAITPDTSDAHGLLYSSIETCHRLRRMVDGLLLHSRLGSKLCFDRVHFSDVIQEAIENLDATIEDTHAIITVGPMPRITVDRQLAVRLVQNIIHNSIRYTPAGRRPNISVTIDGCDDSSVSISFSDNACGIHAHMWDAVFRMFKRCHDGPGDGIGLSTARKIAELHQGSLRVVHSEPNVGTTFHLTLPLPTDHPRVPSIVHSLSGE
jgi:signal transduction histidine kinase